MFTVQVHLGVYLFDLWTVNTSLILFSYNLIQGITQ